MDALVRFCPPPVDPPPVVDRARTGRALGTALPADYKRLVEAYGDGIFDETIWLLAPCSSYDDCDLSARTTERDEALTGRSEMEEEEPAGLTEVGARVLP